MREYTVKTVKVGDSIVVALPRELLAAEKISGDMTLKITVQKCPINHAAPKTRSSCSDDDPWMQLE
jgi:hypothetical protein